jgi:hypothetical protein
MGGHNLIRVIKRAERERLAQPAAGSVRPESSARDKAQESAATVKEWISEFRQSRLAQQQEINRLPGRSENEVNGQGQLIESGARKGEK